MNSAIAPRRTRLRPAAILTRPNIITARPTRADRHAGDLGNIEADASGKAHLELTDKVMKLSGADSIIGHAVIVHEKADDLKTQPTGDAGGRLACGVIGVAKP